MSYFLVETFELTFLHVFNMSQLVFINVVHSSAPPPFISNGNFCASLAKENGNHSSEVDR